MNLALQTRRASFDAIFDYLEQRVGSFVCDRRGLRAITEPLGQSRRTVSEIARRVLKTSQGSSNADGGRHGVGTLRPFSRFGYVGQDTRCEKSNLFFRPIINLVIPIAPVAGRIFHYLTDLRVAAAHDSNRIGEFLSWVTNVLSRTTK